MVSTYSVSVAGSPVRAAFPSGTKCSAWSFANNTTERGLDFETQLPHQYYIDTAKPVYMHLHMSPSSNFSAGSAIGFLVQLSVAKNLGAWTSLYYWLSYTPAAQIDAEKQFMTVDVAIDATQSALFEPSAYIKGTVFRHKGTAYTTANAGSVTENINQSLWFHELDFHVYRNKLGTKTNQISY
jgi:hypothetical protein